MTDESIWAFQPPPGAVVVFAAPDVLSHGELWGLQDRLREAFPDNKSMVVSQHTTLSTRFEPFTEDELVELKDCLEHVRRAKGAIPEADAGAVEAEVDAELGSRRSDG